MLKEKELANLDKQTLIKMLVAATECNQYALARSRVTVFTCLFGASDSFKVLLSIKYGNWFMGSFMNNDSHVSEPFFEGKIVYTDNTAAFIFFL